MSDVPEPAVSAELKAWLFNAITESIPKALAASREQTIPAPTATITQLSDSEDSHASEHEEAPRKRPRKGDSATAGKGKAPAKHPKVPYSKPKQTSSQHDFDAFEGSTSNYNLHVLDEYYAEHSDTEAPPHKTFRDLYPSDSATNEPPSFL
ncbi:Hypothetical predicted protein [Pelobates cultripes]|uniref:Uncharacterized protein n=1 Tax=Pelobates cultripes TaxID=61616 RepID=A0AAD1WC42_PELCU|nr:Hypothetical predicted protein [Pelobates cultripes]